MAIALVGSAQNAGVSPQITGFNSAGADLLFVTLSAAAAFGGATLSDSAGNTWTQLAARTPPAGNITLRSWYCLAPTTSSSHTFTPTASTFATLIVTAWSGVASLDQDVGTSTAGTSPGTLTPAANGALIMADVCSRATGTYTVDSGFTIAQQAPFVSGASDGGAQAYLIQTTAAAVAPTWNVTSALNLVSFLPSASAGNTVAVPKGALTLTGLAPTVAATANQTIAVPNGALTLTGLAPTVTATANQTVAVPKGALSLTGNAPTVTVGNAQTVAVPAGALTLTGNAPTVVTTANQAIAVPAGSLSLTGNAPTVVVGDQQIVLVPAGVLNITGFAPVVIAGGPVVVSVPVGSLSLTGYAPTVTNGSPVTSAPGGVRHKRRRYEIRGRDYFLTEHELSQVLTLVMKEEEPDEEAPPAVVKTVKKVAKAITAVPVVKPTYTAAPAYDALLADMTRQYQAAETLRQIAQQIQEKAIADDDQDIFDILRLIP